MLVLKKKSYFSAFLTAYIFAVVWFLVFGTEEAELATSIHETGLLCFLSSVNILSRSKKEKTCFVNNILRLIYIF